MDVSEGEWHYSAHHPINGGSAPLGRGCGRRGGGMCAGPQGTGVQGAGVA